MTEKLYYQDSHLAEFEAEVLSCEAEQDVYKIVLDRTAFFPEGGGQYADIGHLNEVYVSDAHEKNGQVIHTADKPVTPGMRVTGKINWEERFERMQQHTGEHLVSGLVHQRFGYDNVGFHLGRDYCTLDFNGPITKAQLIEIERDANEGVFRNIAVGVTYPSDAELCQIEYRSKKEIDGQVRIITVPGYDVCACCAPHMNETGEIGLIKLVSMINYKGGVRINMLCGRRALRDYTVKEDNVKAVSELLCVKEYEASEAVIHLKEEQNSLKEKLASCQHQLLAYKAAEVDMTDEIIKIIDSELAGTGPRDLMNLVLDNGGKVCAVFAGTDETGYRYVVGSRSEDVRPYGKRLNQMLDGRGGGKPEMVQGSIDAKKADILCFN